MQCQIDGSIITRRDLTDAVDLKRFRRRLLASVNFTARSPLLNLLSLLPRASACPLPLAGRAIAYEAISPRVVPANAGIHNPWRRFLCEVSARMPKRDDTANGSRRSPGRLVEGITVSRPNNPWKPSKIICNRPALQGRVRKDRGRSPLPYAIALSPTPAGSGGANDSSWRKVTTTF
jgi:hypothetical protein